MTKYPKYKYILQSFGLQNIKTSIYKANIANNPGLVSSSSEYPIQPMLVEKKVAETYLNTPVFDNIIFDVEGENLRIDTVLIDVSQTKNIIKTAIQGMNGTIKEYIADGDYDIGIKGIIVSENRDYPQQDVETLIEILKRPEAIKIASNFLNVLGISTIVIESYSLHQNEVVNQQVFEINAVSDKPQELIIAQ